MKVRCLLSLSLALLLPLASFSASFSLDSQSEAGDSVKWMRVDDGSLRNLQKLERKLHHHLNEIDTNYIEPQRYDFTVMLQSITTYELYRLKTTDGKSITFAPTPLVKMGPYFGWRWIFFGYTIDVKHMFLKQEKSSRKEYDVSIYSSRLGIDLFYRETGNDYKIRRMSVGEGINTHELRGLPFSGLTSTIKGFNIYYIFNYRHFSYPAAFSQSTIQRRSAGSPMLGIGYTRHTLSVDWQALDQLVKERLGADNSQFLIDEDLLFGTINYSDFSLSGGYGYNYVPAKNLLLAASLSLGLSYKRTTSDSQSKRISFRDFSFDNVNLDGIGRFAFVWNTSRWYAGASAVFHAYNYHKDRFSTNNIFGSMNVYIGYNFGRKKK